MEKEYRGMITRLIYQQDVFTKQILEVMHEDNDFYFCKDYFIDHGETSIVLSKRELYVPVICKCSTILFGFDEELLNFIYLKQKTGDQKEMAMLRSKVKEIKKKYRFILDDTD